MTAVQADQVAARLLDELPRALASGQVVAYFQPEIDLATGRVIAAEALTRWEHPEFGILSPALFMPLAERLGLMGALTRLMLRLALSQQRAWAESGWSFPIAVNAGPECVTDPEFPAVIAELLRDEQVPGHMLVLEVSERTATGTVSSSFFAQLAELGVRVALDDFGTGFASLESLGGWPIQDLKLDISLVRPIVTTPSFHKIVATTIDLAHQLGVRVVAEGVESEAVHSALRSLGCDIGQGFLFGRPMPAEQFLGWLHDHGPAPRRRRPGRRPAPAGQAGTAGAVVPGGAAAGPVTRAVQTVRGAVRHAADLVGPGQLIAAVVIMGVYGLWQIFRWGGIEHQALIGDLAQLVPNGAVVVCAFLVTRRKQLSRPIRRAWGMLTIALTLYMLGDVLQLFYEVILHERAYPTWADAAYLSYCPLAFIGMLLFPGRRRSRPEWTRLLLDIGIVFAGGATFIWYIALGPAVASGHGFRLIDIVNYAYPVGDLLLLFGVVSLLARGAPRPAVIPLRLFVAGQLALISADLTYDYITAHSSYLGGDPVDTLWMLALTLLFLAASCQLRADPHEEVAAPPRETAAHISVVPYLAVACSYLLLMVIGLRSVSFDALGGLMVGALALTVLVSARQFTALRDNNELAQRYQELASIDAMTGLHNRRHFMELAEGMFVHARRNGLPLTALMMDVDRFKQINDMCGHAVGDLVLTDLARSCRERVRPGDVAGRYGGDEFVVLLPGAAEQAAERVAGQLTGSPSAVITGGGAPVSYTTSVGIAEIADCEDLPSLLSRADEAMYDAKRAGGGGHRSYRAPAPA
ncbi:MAG: EAL domain-containing protein [Streptosporangiaceae bacterium]